MRLFVCVFACTSVQFLSLSVCLWWFTSLQRCELFVFQVEVEEKSTTKNIHIQPFSLHWFSVVVYLPDFCVFLFVCLFVCQSEEQLQHIDYFCSVEKSQVLLRELGEAVSQEMCLLLVVSPCEPMLLLLLVVWDELLLVFPQK